MVLLEIQNVFPSFALQCVWDNAGFSRHLVADMPVFLVQDGFQGSVLSGTMMSAQPTVIGSHDSLPSSFSYIKDLGMSQVGTFENLGISGMAQVCFCLVFLPLFGPCCAEAGKCSRGVRRLIFHVFLMMTATASPSHATICSFRASNSHVQAGSSLRQ